MTKELSNKQKGCIAIDILQAQAKTSIQIEMAINGDGENSIKKVEKDMFEELLHDREILLSTHGEENVRGFIHYICQNASNIIKEEDC